MIEDNLSLIGQKEKTNVADNSFALGHDTHNRNGIHVYGIITCKHYVHGLNVNESCEFLQRTLSFQRRRLSWDCIVCGAFRRIWH